MRRLLPALVLTLAFALPSLPGAAAAQEFRPVFIGLGSAKIPGIPFDFIAASRAQPYLDWDGHDGLRDAIRAAYVSNLVTGALHSVSVGSFMVAGFAEDDEVMPVALLVNAGCDVAIAVMGLATGLDVLLNREPADIEGTDVEVGAKWTGWMNVVMGGFGALWFAPMVIAALVTAEEFVLGPVIEGPGRLALQIELLPTGIGLRGRW